ncbi:branched-chain amino acid ABC transporter permease [Reyranella soli]|jgi:branched-chain amino acid transport system permease protein|uniref:Branched-chain amino acid ABC transporter permease n=1 Tax=Reyranella soli TaxID=1230389 RepID=A0A512NDE3_9HYPH|nr:branched-chain amino acid ABC transporter permease [Reyranella soli]GEP56968.1 branched-chain amino acid ABC transporter permease [Reyranella soli]
MSEQLIIQLLVSGLGMGFIFALIAIGLTLIYGVMGVVNFAHGEFIMLGMYATYLAYVTWGVDPVLSLPLVVALMFCFGLVVYYVLIRRVLQGSMQSQIFATFGLMVFLQAAAQFVMGADYFAVRNSWLSGVVKLDGVVLPVPHIAAVVGASLATVLLYLLVFRTSVGRQLRAASQDAQAAATLGINGSLMYAFAWGIGAACVGVAASLLANFYYIFPRVGAVFVLLAYVAVALGGFGSIHGALLAGVLIGLMQVVIGFFVSSELKYVPVYLLYLAVVLVRPRGLFGRS